MTRAWRYFLLVRLPIAALIIAAGCLIVGGSLIYALVNENSIDTWDAASLDRKLARLRPVQRPPQLVILGGSSNHYGIDSPLLETLTGFGVTNMATQYQKGFYFAERAVAFLRPGDVVMLPMEYPMYAYAAGESPPFESCFRISHDRQSLDSPAEWAFAVSQCPSRLLFYGVMIGLAKRLGFSPGFAYDAVRENDHGDVITNIEDISGPVDIDLTFSAGMVSPIPVDLPRLAALSVAIEDRGARFLLAFPPVRPAPVGGDTVDPAWLAALDSWAEAHGIEIVGRPRDFVMPPECFLDELHLHRGCTARNSAHLNDILRPYLSSP